MMYFIVTAITDRHCLKGAVRRVPDSKVTSFELYLYTKITEVNLSIFCQIIDKLTPVIFVY